MRSAIRGIVETDKSQSWGFLSKFEVLESMSEELYTWNSKAALLTVKRKQVIGRSGQSWGATTAMWLHNAVSIGKGSEVRM